MSSEGQGLRPITALLLACQPNKALVFEDALTLLPCLPLISSVEVGRVELPFHRLPKFVFLQAYSVLCSDKHRPDDVRRIVHQSVLCSDKHCEGLFISYRLRSSPLTVPRIAIGNRSKLNHVVVFSDFCVWSPPAWTTFFIPNPNPISPP